MRRIVSGVLALTLCASLLCACEEIESSSVQTPMSTNTSLVTDESVIATGESENVSETSKSGEAITEPSISDETIGTSFLDITMKEWDQMNTDAKYRNMENILQYITNSGVTTSLDVVDLVTALDQSGNTSKKKTAYELALNEINKRNEQ